jgi:hypothetical protein
LRTCRFGRTRRLIRCFQNIRATKYKLINSDVDGESPYKGPFYCVCLESLACVQAGARPFWKALLLFIGIVLRNLSMVALLCKFVVCKYSLL